MEEPRQPESFSSCRNVSDLAYYVRNKVELCIQNYMSLDVTATYLEKNHKISKSVTRIVWEQLREENPVFFKQFELRCQMARQMRMFNDMLTKQAVGMFENGLLDISDASPSVRALLRQQHPERVHLLETLASKTKLSSASFAFHNANGPSVASQMQIRYNQRKQVLVPASFAMPNPSGPSVVQSRNPYDQQNQVLNPTSFAMPNPTAQWQIPNEQHLYAPRLALSNANGISVTPLPIPNDQQEQQDQHRFTTNSPLPYANGPSVTQMPIPYDQQEQPLYTTTSLPLPPYANGPSMTQLPVPYDQQEQPHQDPCSTYNDLISFPVAPTFAPPEDPVDWSLLIDPAFDDLRALSPLPPADTNPWPAFDYSPWTDPMPEELSTFELGGDILSAEGMDLNEQQQHLIGQYQSHWQQQQQQQQNVQVQGSNGLLENGDELLCNNFDITPPMQTYTSVHQQQDLNGHYQPQEKVPVETLQRGGRSNGVVNGESNGHHQFYNKLDKSRSKRTCTNVHQSGRVKRHNHEPEALNNADSGDGTQTTGVNQQRSPKARATTRSLTGREQYESEETKQ
ncbi:hypothetical protein Bca4012_081558 [Brassica carinata]